MIPQGWGEFKEPNDHGGAIFGAGSEVAVE